MNLEINLVFLKDRDANSSEVTELADEPEREEDFGREMRTLVLQLEKLHSALEGSFSGISAMHANVKFGLIKLNRIGFV